MRLSLSIAAIAALSLVLCHATASRAQSLTDITVFRLDASNNTQSQGANTRGGDGASNVYLTQGATAINSGDGAGTAIALNLSAPGTYTYNFAFENVNTNTGTQLGINFFFGGAVTPSISVRGVNGVGNFVANGGTTNRPDFFSTVAGANTLTSNISGQDITVTNFTYNATSSADLVTSFNNTPGGTTDTVGSITLRVGAVAVPEANAGLLALLAGVSTLGIVLRKRKAA